MKLQVLDRSGGDTRRPVVVAKLAQQNVPRLQSVISRVDAPSVMIPLDAKLEGVAPLPGVEEEEEDDRPVYENVGRRTRIDFSSLMLLSHVGFLSVVLDRSNRGIRATSPCN